MAEFEFVEDMGKGPEISFVKSSRACHFLGSLFRQFMADIITSFCP